MSLTTVSSFASTPQAKLQELDQDLRTTLTRVAEGGLSDCNEARVAVDSFRARLRLLQEETPPARHKVVVLTPLVENLQHATDLLCKPRQERSREALDSMRSLVSRRPAPDKTVTALAGSDACENAPLIDFGSYTGSLVGATQDGSAGCGSSGGGDVWYRVTTDSYLSFQADTLGSDFDTILSVHLECPGITSNQISCNDDAFGLQSALSSYVYANQSVWIRLSGFNTAAGQYQLNFGTGGSIGGTVTAEADGSPLPGVQVNLYEDSYFRTSAVTAADGSYSVNTAGVSYDSYPGYYLTTTSSDAYADELYLDLPCFGTCDKYDGLPVTAPAAGTRSGIDFDLPAAGRIEGTVTNTAGVAQEDLEVSLWNAIGERLDRDYSAADGSYAFTKLPAGTYYVSAVSSIHVGQVYDGLACPGGPTWDCSATDGTAIAVATGQTVAGIDLQLATFGSISGSIVDQDGNPLSGVNVEIQHANGAFVASGYTDSQGDYTIQGLPAGDYLVEANKSNYLPRYFDGLECGSPGNQVCDLGAATPVAVALNAETTSIDFLLRSIGRISGTITDTNNAPLGGVIVRLYSLPNIQNRSTYTDSQGNYAFTGIGPSTYYVVAGGSGYLYEVYPNAACPRPNGSCDLEDGTGIPIELAEYRDDIDLQLQEGGRLFGQVTDPQGNPLRSWFVYALDVDSMTYVAGDPADLSGNYELSELPAKPVYLVARRCQGCSYDYIEETYPDVSCSTNSDCPLVGATQITPQLAQSLGSFDFQLDRWSTLSGMVYDSTTGQAASGVQIRLWDENGDQVAGTTISSGNPYTLRAANGTYTLTASSTGYHGQLFDGIDCPFDGSAAGCDVTTGSVFTVTTAETFTGIDFNLDPRAVLTGRVISAVDGTGVASRWVDAWTDEAYPFRKASARTDSDGHFFLRGLEGSFTVATDPDSQITTLYDGILCPNGVSTFYTHDCHPAKGTSIAIDVNQPTDILLVEYPRQLGLYGYVTDASTDGNLEGVQVDVWNADDLTLAATATTDARGHYYLALVAGSYYISTRNDLGYTEQVYVGVACPNGSAFAGQCDATQGSLLPLAGNVPIRADFALDEVGGLQLLWADDFEDGGLDGWLLSP